MSDKIKDIATWAPYAPAEDAQFCHAWGEILSQASWDSFLNKKHVFPDVYNEEGGANVWDDVTNNPIPLQLRAGYRSPTPEPISAAEVPLQLSSAEAELYTVAKFYTGGGSSSEGTNSSDEFNSESEHDPFANIPVPNDDSQDDDFEPNLPKRGHRSGAIQQRKMKNIQSTSASGGQQPPRFGSGGDESDDPHPGVGSESEDDHSDSPQSELPIASESEEEEDDKTRPRKRKVFEYYDNHLATDDSPKTNVGKLFGPAFKKGKRVATVNAQTESNGDGPLATGSMKQAKNPAQPPQAESTYLRDRQVRAWDLNEKVKELQGALGPDETGIVAKVLPMAIREYEEHVERYGVPVPRERPLTEVETLAVLKLERDIITTQHNLNDNRATLERNQFLLREVTLNPTKCRTVIDLAHLEKVRMARIRNSNANVEKKVKQLEGLEVRYVEEYRRVYNTSPPGPALLPVSWAVDAEMERLTNIHRKKKKEEQDAQARQLKLKAAKAGSHAQASEQRKKNVVAGPASPTPSVPAQASETYANAQARATIEDALQKGQRVKEPKQAEKELSNEDQKASKAIAEA